MEIEKILAELRAERDRVEEAILSLERMTVGAKRRGRPPLWMKEVAKNVEPPKRRGRPPAAKRKNSE